MGSLPPALNSRRRHFEGGWQRCSDAIPDGSGQLRADAISAASWQRCDGWFFPSKKQRCHLRGVAGSADGDGSAIVADASADVDAATATARMPTAGGRMPILKSAPRRRQVCHHIIVAGWRRPAPGSCAQLPAPRSCLATGGAAGAATKKSMNFFTVTQKPESLWRNSTVASQTSFVGKDATTAACDRVRPTHDHPSGPQ
jgi:hypothetical protein